MSPLPDRLRHYRQLRELSQIELAEQSLVSRRTIARIEAGWDRPNRGTIQLLAQALGVTAEDLLSNGDTEAA